MSADEKIEELHNVIEQFKHQKQPWNDDYQMHQYSLMREQLSVEQEKTNNLQWEKLIVCEILEGDILKVAGEVA